MGYKQEIDALERFVFQVAGLRSYELDNAPPKVTRPVILWEAAARSRGSNRGNYHKTRNVSQFGKLYVNSLQELADIIDKLETQLDKANDQIPVYEDSTATAARIAFLQQVQLDTNTSETTDVPINVRYEATYTRELPVIAPPATSVTTRIKVKEGG